jgi:hypothetical protein
MDLILRHKYLLNKGFGERLMRPRAQRDPHMR